MISVEFIKEILAYDSSTGILTWRVRRGPKAKGSLAGYKHHTGYVQIEINGKAYLAHRLAWAIHYGELPISDIDHINRVKDDNRIENLRLATHSENMNNKTVAKNNTSGYTGVTWYPSRNCWVAKHSRKTIGYYHTIEEAAAARKHYMDLLQT